MVLSPGSALPRDCDPRDPRVEAGRPALGRTVSPPAADPNCRKNVP